VLLNVTTDLTQEETDWRECHAGQYSADTYDWQGCQQDRHIPSTIPPHNGTQLTTTAWEPDPAHYGISCTKYTTPC